MDSTLMNDIKLVNTEDGEIPFLKDCWTFFSTKGVKTSFLSINPLKTFEVDLQICESLGCQINILTNNTEIEEKWGVISRTLKNRKIDDADKDKKWLEGIEKKWILTKNIQVKNTGFNWNTLHEKVNELPQNRIDILKIESNNCDERMILYSMIENGFRPGVLLVKYSNDPDANVPAMLVAGHLQNTGYRLLSCNDSWFLYMYNDLCLYESCSWRISNVNNPLVKYFGDQFTASSKQVQSSLASEVNKEENQNEKKE